MNILTLKINFADVEDIKRFVNITSEIDADFAVYDGHHAADGKSILGMLALDFKKPLSCKVTICPDSETEMSEIKWLLADFT